MITSDREHFSRGLSAESSEDDSEIDDLEVIESPPSRRCNRDTKRLLSILDELDREARRK